jgi:hypothetical protein
MPTACPRRLSRRPLRVLPRPGSSRRNFDIRAFLWKRATHEYAPSPASVWRGDGQPDPAVVETFVNEFWTSRKRAATPAEVSYRACFKPQLRAFFIDRFTKPGDVVYDPFMGRGTTVVEAALAGRIPAGCDINPLSAVLARPRLSPPTAEEVEARLAVIDLSHAVSYPTELEVFYHSDTLREICALREYLMAREQAGTIDAVDRWIRMVAVNRLTGHSPGFFSVYTLPPNQAASVSSQTRINARRRQTPPRREVRTLIAAKTRSLLSDCDSETRKMLLRSTQRARLLTGSAHATPQLASRSVSLVVTSPPFLDVVNYAADNWLRGWFCGIHTSEVEISIHRKVEDWQRS